MAKWHKLMDTMVGVHLDAHVMGTLFTVSAIAQNYFNIV